MLGNIVDMDKQFVYSQGFFLRRVKEELFRSNRRKESFIWIEIPLEGIAYRGLKMQTPLRHYSSISGVDLEAWKIAVQTLLYDRREIDVVGQSKNGLWVLFPNSDLNFLQKKRDEILANVNKAGLPESAIKNLNLKNYFYSGKQQSDSYEENRFIKNWNKTSKMFTVKRISVKDTDAKNFHNLFSTYQKRFIDIIGGICGVIVFSLVMLACAVLVKIALMKWKKEQQSLGKWDENSAVDSSILFKQVRLGLNGKPFRCYKFRTMYPGADKEKEQLKKQQDEQGDSKVDRGPTFKMKNDPRILKFGGNFLRTHSLDELPQFFNVLKGEMSLVGPRPPTPDEVKKYEAWHYIRLSVKPGLTCLWQVSGRNDLDFDEWMRLDNRYVNRQNITEDFKIKLKTVEVMLNGKGAS